MVFIPIQAVCERPVHWLPSKPACGDRKLWKMTAENMLLHDFRRFRKDEAGAKRMTEISFENGLII
ncbi:hypothetical protein PPE_06375 [Paenibacillus polymyxa E681]|nr:hypothetical protein PPE_06375 [Paenibacillus polymyxa E681]